MDKKRLERITDLGSGFTTELVSHLSTMGRMDIEDLTEEDVEKKIEVFGNKVVDGLNLFQSLNNDIQCREIVETILKNTDISEHMQTPNEEDEEDLNLFVISLKDMAIDSINQRAYLYLLKEEGYRPIIAYFNFFLSVLNIEGNEITRVFVEKALEEVDVFFENLETLDAEVAIELFTTAFNDLSEDLNNGEDQSRILVRIIDQFLFSWIVMILFLTEERELIEEKEIIESLFGCINFLIIWANGIIEEGDIHIVNVRENMRIRNILKNEDLEKEIKEITNIIQFKGGDDK